MAGRQKASHHTAAKHVRREQALDAALEDSFPASDPIAATQPAPSDDDQSTAAYQITRHDKSDVVELSDGSRWRIWPEDLRKALGWQPTTALRVVKIDDRFCSHALVNPADKSRTRVIEAHRTWPIEEVRKSLKNG
jgi:hypothetical protein